MAGKMDQTNAQLDSTSAKMDQTNNTLGVVASATHKQIMSGGLDDMVSDTNTKVLVPVPFGMLPGGKTFAEEAYESDLMDWFYAQIKSIEEGTADDTQRVAVQMFLPKLDANGNQVLEAQYSPQTIGGHSYMVPQLDWDFPQTYLDSFNRQKDIILNEMQVVAYFIPQPMIETIVADEIDTGGLRQETAYLILNLRDVFARSGILQNTLYNDKLKTLDQVKEALRIVNDIDYIAHLPCTALISQTKLSGYIDMSANYIYEQQVNPSDLSKVCPVATPAFVPVDLAYDPSQPINNTMSLGTYYNCGTDGNACGSDNMTVVPVDQSGARTAEIAYDPAAYQQDWKDLKRHFQSDLTKADQNSDEGQGYLTEIQSHIK